MVHWFRTSSVKSLAAMTAFCTVRTDEVYSQKESGSAWLCLRKASPHNARNYLKCCKVSMPSVYGWRVWLVSFSKQEQQQNGTRFIVRYAMDYIRYMFLLLPDNYHPEEYIKFGIIIWILILPVLRRNVIHRAINMESSGHWLVSTW